MSLRCSENKPFLCSDERLVLVKQNKTWEEALDHCRTLRGADQEDHRYDLARLDPADEDYASELIEAAGTDEVWTGLRFLAGGWFWVSGEPVPYEDVQSCQSPKSCGVLVKRGKTKFQIRDCSKRKNFLCYRSPQSL